MTNGDLFCLAKEYRDSANAIKEWLAKHPEDSENFLEKRVVNQAREMLRELSQTARYLEKYYVGNRMDCAIYDSIHPKAKKHKAEDDG